MQQMQAIQEQFFQVIQGRRFILYQEITSQVMSQSKRESLMEEGKFTSKLNTKDIFTISIIIYHFFYQNSCNSSKTRCWRSKSTDLISCGTSQSLSRQTFSTNYLLFYLIFLYNLPFCNKVSRTFGDIEAKIEKLGGNPNVVISDPEIKSFKITDDHDFIILASKHLIKHPILASINFLLISFQVMVCMTK